MNDVCNLIYTNVRADSSSEFQFMGINIPYVMKKLDNKRVYEQLQKTNGTPDIRVCINYEDQCDFVTIPYRTFISDKNKYGVPTEQVRNERSRLTPKLRWQVLSRDNWTCQYCGAKASDGVKLHVDHVIPVSRGGKTVLDNLVTACEKCNLGKSDSEVV